MTSFNTRAETSSCSKPRSPVLQGEAAGPGLRDDGRYLAAAAAAASFISLVFPNLRL